jgi:hypothetical protein
LTDLFYNDLDVPSGQYDYCVNAEYSAGESDDVCEAVGVAVGLSESQNIHCSVYPNPVDDILIVQSDEIIKELSISSMTGQVVFQSKVGKTSMSLNTNALDQGVYIIRIITPSGISVSRFVVR